MQTNLKSSSFHFILFSLSLTFRKKVEGNKAR